MDGLVRLWQVSNGTLVRSLKGHAGWVTGLDFSQDGKYLASCSDDFTVRIWRVSDYKLIQTIDEGMASITSVNFSPDATQLAWSEIDGTVRVRSFSGVWLQNLKVAGLEANYVTFSPQGDRLAAGYSNGSIRIWGVEDGALQQTIRSQSQAISGLAYSPDGRWLVTGSRDKTLVLWRLDEADGGATPALIYTGHLGPVTSVDFSPQGNLVASASEDGTIRLWPVPEQ
jgi:WD40 repeat protein